MIQPRNLIGNFLFELIMLKFFLVRCRVVQYLGDDNSRYI